jgi:translation initiation factor IF-1
MPKTDLIELEGVLTDALGGGQYAIKQEGGTVVRAQLCGKMKKLHIRVMPGDRVKVSVSPYDTSHGLITWRYK